MNNRFHENAETSSRHDVVYIGGPAPKQSGAKVCRECHDIWNKGRWTWNRKQVHKTLEGTVCPACVQKARKISMGEILVRGEFYRSHEQEIDSRIRNIEQSEKSRHPLERIIGVEKSIDTLHLLTAGMHVARRIGSGLEKSYKGELTMSHTPGDGPMRVQWVR